VDFEALAHVLANTCRWGGRSRHYLSLAQHAVAVSEEVEGLDGLGPAERRTLALHALLGLVERMVDAAERRDLRLGAAPAGVAFPPARRRVRPAAPARAARLWLARFEALSSPPAGGAEVAETAGGPEALPDAA